MHFGVNFIKTSYNIWKVPYLLTFWQLAKTLLTHSCVCPKPVVWGVFTPHSERLGGIVVTLVGGLGSWTYNFVNTVTRKQDQIGFSNLLGGWWVSLPATSIFIVCMVSLDMLKLLEVPTLKIRWFSGVRWESLTDFLWNEPGTSYFHIHKSSWESLHTRGEDRSYVRVKAFISQSV